MLTKRQFQILNTLSDHLGETITGEHFSRELGVSTRTIQNDIKDLREQILDLDAEIESKVGSGYILIVENEASFKKKISSLLKARMSYLNFEDQDTRTLYILKCLLLNNREYKADRLAYEVSISKSRLTNDLNKVRVILEKYKLDLVNRPSHGLAIEGSEINKRRCIAFENIQAVNFVFDGTNTNNDRQLLSDISEITIEEMIKAKYKTSDVILQNIIMHIMISVNRIIMKKNIQDNILFDDLSTKKVELELADVILSQLAAKYHFTYPRQEVYFLALNLIGKKNYDSDDVISSEIDTLVIEILEEIKSKTGFDLSFDVELRISLALHLVPLQLRIRHNMQIENVLKDDIKKHFTLAYDLAVIAAKVLQKEKNTRLSEDEIGYIAIHINLSLQKLLFSQKPKHILVLCSSRRSDSLLLKYKLLRWFKEVISEIDVRNFVEIGQFDLSQYDVIFTTSFSDPRVPESAIKINYFLDEYDQKRIERSLTGVSNFADIIQYFPEELFLPNLICSDQDDAIHKMVQTVKANMEVPEEYEDAIIRRERLGSTAFGNSIAIPHPDGLITKQTFVCAALLNQPILWGEIEVQMVFLVSIKKGNDRDFRDLFETLSKVLTNTDGISKVLRYREYGTLVDLLRTASEGM